MVEKNTDTYVRSLISKNLKRFRALQKISQLDLGLKAGLTHNFINDIENCKKGLSVKTIAKLCVALRIEPHELFLPENMTNNKTQIFLNEINNSIYKAVQEVTSQYLQGNGN